MISAATSNPPPPLKATHTLISFHEPNRVPAARAALAEHPLGGRAQLIPTPRQIQASCGMSLLFDAPDLEESLRTILLQNGWKLEQFSIQNWIPHLPQR